MNPDRVLDLFREYEACFRDLPDMTGLDWAADQGWIEREEWEHADKKAKEILERRLAFVGEISSYRKEFREEFDVWLATKVAQRIPVLQKEERLRLQEDLRAFMEGRLDGLAWSFLVSQVLLAKSPK